MALSRKAFDQSRQGGRRLKALPGRQVQIIEGAGRLSVSPIEADTPFSAALRNMAPA